MQTYKVYKIKNDIPQELWNQVKAACIIQKKKFSVWITEAIREKLEREKK